MIRAFTMVRHLLLVAVMAAVTVPAFGQGIGIGTYAVIRNEYVEVKLGIRNQNNPSITNVGGRISYGTTGGDPLTPADDNEELTWNHYRIVRQNEVIRPGCPHDYSSWTTLRIDDLDWNGIYGDPGSGVWELAPIVGPSNSYIRGVFRTNTGNIRIELRLDLCRDMVRHTYTILNEDSVPHSVGIRKSWDEIGEDVDNLGGGFVSFKTIPYVPGIGVMNGEFEFTGALVPDYVDHLDVLPNPGKISRQLWRDPAGVSDNHMTPPDRVVVGEYSYMVGRIWNFDIVPDRIPQDTYTYAWWNPKPLMPGQSRKIVAYFGLGVADSDFRSPYVLAVQSPRSLTQSSSSDSGLTPDPFSVDSYIYNLYTDVDISSSEVHLSLPAGLQLAPGETSTKTIGSIGPQQEGRISWQVRPTGEVAGKLTYFVTASGSGIVSKTVGRSVLVPSTLTTRFSNDWQMMSIPFSVADSSPAEIFQVPASSLEAVRYAPNVGEYVTLEEVMPGEGFWLRSSTARTVTLNNATPVNGSATYQVPLKTGWNQFGNPFIYNVSWGRVKVLRESSGLNPVSVSEAVSRGWIKPTIYWWDTNSRNYDRSSEATVSLVPWRGYWLKALVPCKLVIPPIDPLDGQVIAGPLQPAGSRSADDSRLSDGWKVQLVATAGDVTSSKAFAGVSSRASDGYCEGDIETPPLMRDYVSITFPHTDWGTESGRYVEDLRRADGSAKTWDMEVSTDKQNTDVVLIWPDLSQAPKDYALKLVDVDANVTRYLRTTSSYRYNSGTSTTRRFKLVADPSMAGRLTISGLTVAATKASRNATISYTLSADAITQVRIMKGAGGTVRTLVNSGSSSRGIASQSWDYRDDTGNSVDPGAYMVEVTATTPEGETAKMVAPLIIPR